MWGSGEKLVLKTLIWELSVYRWHLKAKSSDERNNRAFDNSKEVAAWPRTKNSYGLRLLAAVRKTKSGADEEKCW